MKIYADLFITVKDKDGNIKYKDIRPVNSFVENFFKLFYNRIRGSLPAVPVTKTDNTATTLLLDTCTATANITTYGIIVGTGTTPVSFTDTKLMDPISGTLLYYGVTEVSDAIQYGSAYQLLIGRPFTNNSGSQVTITEIGIVTVDLALFVRDLLNPSVTIAPSEIVVFEYAIRLL
ncbi:MAG: hypothetical protein QW416_07970 [Candidatus Nitrosocaldaceae archaeon]